MNIAKQLSKTLHLVYHSGSAVSILNRTITLAIGLISVPISLGYLTKNEYGFWMLAMSVVTIVNLLDSGFSPTLRNKITESIASGETAKYKKYIRINFTISLYISIFAILLLIPLSFLDWNHILNIQEQIPGRTVNLVLGICYLTPVINILFSVASNIYIARRNFKEYYLAGSICSIIGFVLFIITITLKLGLPAIVLAYSSGPVLAKIYLFLKLDSDSRPLFKNENRVENSDIIKILPTTLTFLLLTILDISLSTMPNVFIAKYFSMENITDFSITFRLVSIPLSFFVAIYPVFWPQFTEYWIKGEKGKIVEVLKRMMTLCSLIIIAYSILLLPFADKLVLIWTKGKVILSYPLITTLLVYLFLQVNVYWLSTFLNSISRVRFQVYILTVVLVSQVGIALLLKNMLGIYSLTISMCITLLFFGLLPYALIVRNIIAAPK